jgi:predicted unusual protein kinase regulating ubiquinone biosynthesis (AarF/ABC1/UbiB family)
MAVPSAISPFARLGDVVCAGLELARNVTGNVDRLVNDALDDARHVARELEALADAAGSRGAELYELTRATPRFGRVVGEGLRLLALHRLAAARSALLGRPARADAALHARTARRLHDLCVELRGGVLKLGQFVSTRVDLLPPEYVHELGKLQDRVPALPPEPLLARIEAALGPIGERFASFDRAAIAAASLAQVHAATLPGGRAVVVKAQVPGVEEQVRADLAALRVLAPLFGELVPGLDCDTISSNLSRSVEAELDYEREAAHAAAFAVRFAGDPDVVVPEVVPDLCSERVLVLERIRGVRLLEWLDACEARGEQGARDRDRLLGILVRCLADQVLTHGLLQTDPHPGNFLVVPGDGGPKLALLDFGSVQTYTRERRRSWARLGLAIVARDEASLARLFAELGFESRGGDDSLRAFADLLLEHFRPGADLALAYDARRRMEHVFGLLRENPIVRIPDDFVQMGRIFGAVGGLLLRYQPRVDLFTILAPRLAAAAA